jgi:cytoskeletal protein RodZ
MSLEALERSDLSRLPGGIFTRAFIRAYAQEVGLDPDRTIQDFIAELPREAASATAHSVAVEDGEKLESDRRAVATAVRLVLISIPIIALVVYYGTHGPATRSQGGEAAPAESPSSASEQVPQEPIARETAPPCPQGHGMAALRMEMSPREPCWSR